MVLTKLSRLVPHMNLILFLYVFPASSYVFPGSTWNYPSRENIVTPRPIRGLPKSRQPVHSWGFPTTSMNALFTYPTYGFKTIRSFRKSILKHELAKENPTGLINIQTQTRPIDHSIATVRLSIQEPTTVKTYSSMPFYISEENNNTQNDEKMDVKHLERNLNEDNISKELIHNFYSIDSIETNNRRHYFEPEFSNENVNNQKHHHLNSLFRHYKDDDDNNQEPNDVGNKGFNKKGKERGEAHEGNIDHSSDLNKKEPSFGNRLQEVNNKNDEHSSNTNNSNVLDVKRPRVNNNAQDQKTQHDKDKHIGYSKTLVDTKGSKESSPVDESEEKKDCKQPKPAIKEEEKTVAGALRCYSCDNQTSASCQPITPYTNQTVCAHDHDKCYIIHTKNIFTDKFTMRRVCGHKNTCTQIDSVATEVKKCFSCRTDLCNNAFSTNTNFSASLILVSFIIIFIRF